ncbi:M48 family metalloprotease [Hamadaea tsunoensis]|uniref:M48 family metalloprotease n=1 Tax=Hamadaea tsunoensis TaxID=53368 RepID=UPI0003F76721|nr:M48 family metallopeptidase [Hamadaea tsunoensis]
MTQTAPITTDQACPQCHARLVSEYDATPWCERCEWNLGAFEPDKHDGWFARRQATFIHDAGYDLSSSLFTQLAGRTAGAPGLGLPLVVLLLISGVMLAIFLGVIAVGAWLVVTQPFLVKIVGLLLIGFALPFTPKFGSPRKRRAAIDELSETEAPHLYSLIRRTAEAVGAPMPHHIGVEAQWNASTAVLGLRRRRFLVLGLPLWRAARPQERVALLGHELGHFVNNDVARRVAAYPALNSFGTAADLIHPSQLRRLAAGATGWAGGLMMLCLLLAYPFLWLASNLLWLAHLGAHAIGARSSQRAEYYADDLEAYAAGTAAALSLEELLTLSQGLIAVIGGRSRSRQTGDGWRQGVEEARSRNAERMPRLLQLTIRTEASIFATHPPQGLRHRMLTAAPYREPRVVLTEGESAAIDAELARFEERYRREIAESW